MTIGYEDYFDVSTNLEIKEIHKDVYKKDRFTLLIVAIIDYDMPKMNGLELARALKSKTPVKIIMLTGEADQNTAVIAFNNREIDRFVQKSASDYHDKLLEYIEELQLEYFIEFSAGIVDSLASKAGHPLQDADFVDLFKKICHENSIVEYYLLDESGSFLMYDRIGNATFLIVRTDEDMATFCELAADDGASEDILTSLEKREKVVVFPNTGNPIPPVSKWYFYLATQLKNKKIYYSLIKGKEPGLKTKAINNYEYFVNS